ncbi:unnamed protein product [Umbelopsis vinacea]
MSRNQRGYASVVRGEDTASTSTAVPDALSVVDAQSPPMGTITTVKGTSDFNYGIIHLYKDNGGVLISKASEKPALAVESTSAETGISYTTEIDTHDGTVACVLAVPSYMSATDFLKFTAPVNQDTAPNKYMVVMKFRDSTSTQDFYRRYNGKPFSSMEPEICHVVYIKSVEIDTSMIAPYTFPFLYETLKEDRKATLTGDDDDNEHHGETATTASAASALQSEEANECFVCGATESLWICLICGHIGCGRYNDAHAYHHYMETNHLYALELETQRVWDYAGDGYVHRLIQNTIDGKLVELPGATNDDNQRVPQVKDSPIVGDMEKLDAVSLEYTYLLTSQLESQRMYYEDHLTSLTSQLSTLSAQVKTLAGEIQLVRTENDSLVSHQRVTEKRLKEADKEREKAEKRMETFKEKCETIRKEWQEEKEMTTSLAKNNEHLKLEMKLKDKAIVDLSDQVRDLMFFLESREKINDNPELEGGSVEVGPSAKGKKVKRGKR